MLALVCILTLFFFPAMSGPYSAIHGPVTTLQSVRSAARLRVAMILAGLSSLWNNRSSLQALRSKITVLNGGFLPEVFAERSTILRC